MNVKTSTLDKLEVKVNWDKIICECNFSSTLKCILILVRDMPLFYLFCLKRATIIFVVGET